MSQYDWEELRLELRDDYRVLNNVDFAGLARASTIQFSSLAQKKRPESWVPGSGLAHLRLVAGVRNLTIAPNQV